MLKVYLEVVCLADRNPSESSDFTLWNLDVWRIILGEIFPSAIPRRALWRGQKSIIRILTKIGSIDDLAHLFFPDGGGLDLDGARRSNESGCVELKCGTLPYIFKPRNLTFESFGDKFLELAYFRIEAAKLEPSGVYEHLVAGHEELTEIESGLYLNRSVIDGDTYETEDETKELPLGARGVTRYLGGSFVVFAKGSLYNRIRATYDGRHAKMNRAEFRKHVGLLRSPVKGL